MPEEILASIGRIARIAIAAAFVSVFTPIVAHAHGRETAAATPCATRLAGLKQALEAHRIIEAETALQVSVSACAKATPEEKRDLAAADIEFGKLVFPEHPDLALMHFSAALSRDPDNPRAALAVSAAQIKLGKYNEAIVVLDGAIARGTDDREVLFKLEYNAGFAWLNLCTADRQCDITKPEAHFQRAIELKPEFPDSYDGLAAIVHDRRHDCARATMLYKKACDRGLERSCVQYRWFTANNACRKAED